MPTLTYPGVYIQEVSSGVRPIAVASTSTAAFVGLAQMGPSVPTRVTNWTEFQRSFGTFNNDGYLAYGVFQFFNNGGQQCYIVRVVRSDAATANVTVQNRANPAVNGLTFSAKNSGAWGNFLYLQIEDGTADPGNGFKLSVRQQTDPSVVPANFANITPLEVFDNLSMNSADPNYVVTVLTQNSNFITAQVLATNTSTQRGFHRGGFGPVLPLNANNSFQISLDNDGYQVVTLPAAATASTNLSDIATAIQTIVTAFTPKKTSTSAAAFTGFTCTVDTVSGQSRLLLQSGTNSATSAVDIQAASANDATSMLKLGAANGGVSQDGNAVQRPAAASVVQIGDNAIAAPVTAVTLGSDGTATLTEQSFANAFPLLDNITDFSVLAVPGESTAAMADLGMGYCSNRPLQDVFYIGEVASTDTTADEAVAFRNRLTTANSYGAIYFPWVQALDPTGASSQPILLPPSGYIAGLYARIDGTRGVWKAPAGTEASLNGVVGLAANLSDVQHGILNPISINAIRQFAGSGIVSFGARTIASDVEWKYVPVRRTAIMLRVSIYYGIQWAVFEPNDEPLWSELRLNIGSFMTTLFRQGAFQGSTPSQAFFVKCDSETTTQADIDNGVVNILIGFAPLKPAEFVVVKISQTAGQASA
ncbi:MAG: phage tail sheath C-terminal domain-containing protein [Bryobacteraceae bacterium]